MAKSRIRTNVFRGLNRRDGAPEGAFLEVSGLSTDAYPALQVRPQRNRVGSLQNVTDVYETDGHLIVIAGNKLYYDNRELRDVTPGQKQFAELGRKLVIWPDKIYINLNTAEVSGMAASASGKVTLRNGALSVNTEGGSGTLSLENAYGYDSRIKAGSQTFLNYYTQMYENLRYVDGWVYDFVEIGLPTLVGEEGESQEFDDQYYFIANGGEPFVSEDPYGTVWPTSGTMYGRFTEMTITKVTKEFVEGTEELLYATFDVQYNYEILNAADIGLTNFFKQGEVVSVEGSKLEYNNKEAAVIANVTDEQIRMSTGFVDAAHYYDVPEPLAEGVYRLVTGADGVVFRTDRKIRPTEQLFTVTDAGNSGLETGSVYAYDLQTQALEKMEPSEESGYTDLDAIQNAYTGETEAILTIERTVPDMQFICERDNRLYGVSNAEVERVFNTETGKWETVTSRVLHASALGEPTRWNVFEGASTDSYAVAIAGDGDFTALVNYSGSVIAFKEEKMYKLTGDYPAEFYLRSYSWDGVKAGCHKSAVIINEVLYYLSPYGVMQYTGGAPSLISYDLGEVQTTTAAGGRNGTKYMLAMGGLLYTYDTLHRVWVSEAYGNVTDIESVGNRAYIVTDGKIMRTGDGTAGESVEWYAITHWIDEGTFLYKDYGEMNLDAALTGGAEMKIEFRLSEDEAWRTLKTLTNYHAEWQTRDRMQGERNHWQMIIPVSRADRIQFRLSGKGPCKIYAIDRVVQVASDKP